MVRREMSVVLLLCDNRTNFFAEISSFTAICNGIRILFENISSDSLWFSVSREVGSNFIRTRVCSVNSKLMYFSGLKSLKTKV